MCHAFSLYFQHVRLKCRENQVHHLKEHVGLNTTIRFYFYFVFVPGFCNWRTWEMGIHKNTHIETSRSIFTYADLVLCSVRIFCQIEQRSFPHTRTSCNALSSKFILYLFLYVGNRINSIIGSQFTKTGLGCSQS